MTDIQWCVRHEAEIVHGHTGVDGACWKTLVGGDTGRCQSEARTLGSSTTGELIEELKERSGCYGFDRSSEGLPEIHFSFLNEEWDYERDGHGR